jgi:hypothetical protein
LAATAAVHSKIASSTVANVYHPHAVDRHLETSANPETTLSHVTSTFLAHEEVLETAHPPPGQHILTPLHHLRQQRLSVVALVVAAAEVISNFAVAAVVGGTSTIATCSEGTVRRQCHAGQETLVKSLAKPVSQRDETKDVSRDVMKNAGPSGLIVSAMQIGQEGTRRSLASRTGHQMTPSQAEHHTHLQRPM